MPIVLQGNDLPLLHKQIEQLWQAVVTHLSIPDESVVVRCVSAEEIRTLNRTYRGKDRVTNILTFSYPPFENEPGEHEVVLCQAVAEEEAAGLNVSLSDYDALLLVHAFLHVGGMDHERSEAEAVSTGTTERLILQQSGFPALHLA